MVNVVQMRSGADIAADLRQLADGIEASGVHPASATVILNVVEPGTDTQYIETHTFPEGSLTIQEIVGLLEMAKMEALHGG